MTTDHAIDHRARRAAKSVGLIARKKHGGFQLIEPLSNAVVAGERFDLSAEEVLEVCKARAEVNRAPQ
jgi:hypothetical protein